MEFTRTYGTITAHYAPARGTGVIHYANTETFKALCGASKRKRLRLIDADVTCEKCLKETGE